MQLHASLVLSLYNEINLMILQMKVSICMRNKKHQEDTKSCYHRRSMPWCLHLCLTFIVYLRILVTSLAPLWT